MPIGSWLPWEQPATHLSHPLHFAKSITITQRAITISSRLPISSNVEHSALSSAQRTTRILPFARQFLRETSPGASSASKFAKVFSQQCMEFARLHHDDVLAENPKEFLIAE